MFQPFPAICLQLTRAVGEHTLQPSPSLDESKWLLPLNVVTMKKKRTWILRCTNKYSTHNIPLKDLLIDQHALATEVEESPFCSYNPESTYSLNGKFQAGINAIIGANFSGSSEGTITSKLGELLLREIEYSNFMFALKERKLDMKHHFITEIIPTGAVLCVINGVITTSGKAEIKCTNKTDGNIKVSEKVRGTIDVDIGAATGSSNYMVIEPRTTLAYKVWKLKVDLDSGEMIPMMMEDNSGGFFKKPPPQSNVQKKKQPNVKSGGKRSVQKKTQPNVKSGGKRSGKHNKGNRPSHSNDTVMQPLRKRSRIYSAINDKDMESSRKRIGIDSLNNDKDMESFWKRIGIDSLNNVQKKTQPNVKSRGKRSLKHNEGNPPPHSNDTVMQPLRKRTRIYSAINDKDMESFWKRIGIDSLNNDKDMESFWKRIGIDSLNNDEYGVALTLQELQGILQPLRDCTEADGQPIKSSLLDLLTCYSDAVAMSTILSKAEKGSLNEDKDSLDKQFINNDTVWSILTFVGVKTEEGKVLYERKATPILIAVAYMIDAILELENDDLDKIYHFDEPQLKTLSKIFESAVASSKTISIDVDMSLVLKEPVSSFLTRQKFTVCNDSIQPPKAKTCIVECIFCVLYCLS